MSVFPLLIHRNSTRSFDESWHSSEKKIHSRVSLNGIQIFLASQILVRVRTPDRQCGPPPGRLRSEYVGGGMVR